MRRKNFPSTFLCMTRRELIATVHNRYGDRTISRFDYVNDEIGRRIARIDSGEAFEQTAFERYSYNGRSEVIGSQRFDGADTEDLSHPVPGRAFFYGYDPIGNRTNSAETIDGVLETKTYTANALNQYETIQTLSNNDPNPKTIALEYDDDGNMIFDGRFRYSWNAENRMIYAVEADAPTNQPATTVDYTYDHQGRMVTKNIAGTNTISSTLLWDGEELILGNDGELAIKYADMKGEFQTIGIVKFEIVRQSCITGGGISIKNLTWKHAPGSEMALEPGISTTSRLNNISLDLIQLFRVEALGFSLSLFEWEFTPHVQAVHAYPLQPCTTTDSTGQSVSGKKTVSTYILDVIVTERTGRLGLPGVKVMTGPTLTIKENSVFFGRGVFRIEGPCCPCNSSGSDGGDSSK